MKNKILLALVFLVKKEEKNIHFMCLETLSKRSIFIINRRKKQKALCTYQRFQSIDFCRYCLQTFSTEEILKFHINDCFRISGK